MAEPVRALDLPARTKTIYPPPYDAALAGRAKRALGDVFNLTQFGVNLTVLAPGAASARATRASATTEIDEATVR